MTSYMQTCEPLDSVPTTVNVQPHESTPTDNTLSRISKRWMIYVLDTWTFYSEKVHIESYCIISTCKLALTVSLVSRCISLCYREHTQEPGDEASSECYSPPEDGEHQHTSLCYYATIATITVGATGSL